MRESLTGKIPFGGTPHMPPCRSPAGSGGPSLLCSWSHSLRCGLGSEEGRGGDSSWFLGPETLNPPRAPRSVIDHASVRALGSPLKTWRGSPLPSPISKVCCPSLVLATMLSPGCAQQLPSRPPGPGLARWAPSQPSANLLRTHLGP